MCSSDLAFVLQASKDFVARDLEDDFLESADLGGTALEMLAFPSAILRIALIHAHDVARKEGGLVATCSRSDFNQGIAFLVGILGEESVLQGFFQLGQLFFQGRDFLQIGRATSELQSRRNLVCRLLLEKTNV